MQSDFRLPKQTDDFLQTEVEPDIPSQVSQLTITTEYGGVEPTSKQGRERKSTLIKDFDIRKISGDFAVGTFTKLSSRTTIATCEDMFLIKLEPLYVK